MYILTYAGGHVHRTLHSFEREFSSAQHLHFHDHVFALLLKTVEPHNNRHIL